MADGVSTGESSSEPLVKMEDVAWFVLESVELQNHLRPTSQPSSQPTSIPTLAPPPPKPPFSNITIIVSTTVLLLVLTFLLAKTFLNHEEKNDERKYIKPSRTFLSFFYEIIPVEFVLEQYWEELYLKQLTFEHDFICSYNGSEKSLRASEKVDRDIYDKVAAWSIGAGKIVMYLCLCTLFITYHYEDPGSCEKLLEKDTCLEPLSNSLVKPMCRWIEKTGQETGEETGKCTFSDLQDDFLTMLSLFTMIVLLEAFIDKIIRCLIRHAIVMIRINWDYGLEMLGLKIPAAPIYPTLSRFAGKGDDVEDGKYDIVENFNHHDTMIGDEFVIKQSMKTTMMRAAVFKLMKDNIDFVTPERELSIMLDIWMNPKHPLNFNTWLPKKSEFWRKATERWAPDPQSLIKVKTNSIDAIAAKLKAWQMDVYDISDPYTVLDMLMHNHATPEGKSLIVRQIKRCRQRADDAKNELRQITLSYEKDRFLINKFIIESYCGYRKRICESILFHPTIISMRRADNRYLQFAGIWFLPVFFLGTIIYTYFAGSALGYEHCSIYGRNARTYHWGCDQWNPKTTLWVSVMAMVLFFDVCVLQPLKILIKWVYLPWQAKEDYTFLHKSLAARAKGILSKKVGLMKNANSLIQHFNPVCRAARSVPHLPCSRLLMTITDYDLPLPLSVQQKHMHLFDKDTFMGNIPYTVYRIPYTV